MWAMRKSWPLHLALAIGDDGGELRFEALDDGAGVGAFGREDGGGCGGFGSLRGKEFEAKGSSCGAGHGSAGFGVVDEFLAAFGKIAFGIFRCGGLTGDVIQGRA